jgi:hypothetical protein
MRGPLKFLLVALGLAAVYFIRDFWDARQVRAESEGFAEQAVNMATSSWADSDFRKLRDPYLNIFLVNGAEIGDFSYSLATYSRLGKPRREASCAMHNFTTFKDEKEDYVAANYLCDADFEKGAATIIIAVRRFTSGGAWKMSYFDVRSPLLANVKAQPKREQPGQEPLWNKYRNMLPSMPSMPSIPSSLD